MERGGHFQRVAILKEIERVIILEVCKSYCHVPLFLFSGDQFVWEQYSEHERSSKPQLTARD